MSPPVRKLAIVLGVSIALNLFLLGMLSVQLLYPRRVHPGPSDAWGRPQLLFRAGEVFDGDHPRAARILREHRKDLRAQRRAIRDARSQVQTALEAEPFEKEALERQLSALRRHTQNSQEVLHQAFVELAVEATPEQRRRLARWADKPHPPRHPGMRPRGPRNQEPEAE